MSNREPVPEAPKWKVYGVQVTRIQGGWRVAVTGGSLDSWGDHQFTFVSRSDLNTFLGDLVYHGGV